MKPLLTEENKIDRVRWALSIIYPQTLEFTSMHYYVVFDEKSFQMSETTRTFYLRKDEPEPERSGKSSRYTPKVMFLAVIARPRFDASGEFVFDGKIGFWPFIETVAAKRNCWDRPAGTIEPKSVFVNRDVYCKYITEKVIPAIRRKWQGPKSELIVMQQDNAPCHWSIDDVDFAEEGQRFRWNIKMTNQLANSPDFNVLGLGFFRCVQSLQYKHAPRTVQGLINTRNAAFDAYEPHNIDSNFISLQKCMECSLMKHGGNR